MERVRRPSPQTSAVLVALADGHAGWCYGYDLCRSLGLKAGTIYPILIRLAERGYVESTWERDPPSGRPARHLYRLSERGADLVAELPDARAHGATRAGATGHVVQGALP